MPAEKLAQSQEHLPSIDEVDLVDGHVLVEAIWKESGRSGSLLKAVRTSRAAKVNLIIGYDILLAINNVKRR